MLGAGLRARSWTLASAAVTGMVVLVVAAWLDVRAVESAGTQARTAARLDALDTAELRVQSLLLNVETGKRGYLLTSRPEFLEPYETARRDLPSQLDLVDRLAATDPSERAAAVRLRELAEAKLAYVASSIDIHDVHGPERAESVVASGRGKAITQELQSAVAQAHTARRVRLQAYAERAQAVAERAQRVRQAAAGLLLALLGVMLGLVRRDNRREGQRRADARAREALVHQLAAQSVHDSLTGQPNRRLLEDRMAQALARSARSGGLLAVLFIDLDHFKDINDRHGHAVGDQVLVAVAQRIRSVLRGTDTLARVGGDEFVALCEEVSGESAASELAQLVSERLAQPVEAGGLHLDVTASIGVVVADHRGIRLDGAERTVAPSSGPVDLDALLSAADEAMYCAKSLGRSRHHAYGAEVDSKRQARVTLLSDLREALVGDPSVGGRLWVAYQPLVQLDTGEVVGVEALCRWAHPTLGEVSPATFIPVAEASGLITPLGDLVVRTACAQVDAWNRQRRVAGLPDLYVSVNCSARQLLHPGYAGRLADILRDSGTNPSALVIELTESVMVDSVAGAAARLQSLADTGVRLALDDFGTGYSSLAYLRRFPFDIIKIDRGFAAGLGKDDDDEAIVTSVVAMAHALGRSLVIEGIETSTQAQHARRLGCGYAQGYHYGRPQAAERLSAVLLRPAPGRRSDEDVAPSFPLR